AAHYLNFGLELLVPEHMWINEVCTYDISSTYGIPFGGLIVKNSTLTGTLLTQAASDGMLMNIMEALDFRVKEYNVNQLNPDSRPEGSSKTWNASLVVAYEILTTDCFREPDMC
nr:hypothetical protein [Tanacetum cinerariifolium]